jgi:hypothetical protein
VEGYLPTYLPTYLLTYVTLCHEIKGQCDDESWGEVTLRWESHEREREMLGFIFRVER